MPRTSGHRPAFWCRTGEGTKTHAWKTIASFQLWMIIFLTLFPRNSRLSGTIPLILQHLAGGLEPIAHFCRRGNHGDQTREKNIRGVQFHPEAVLTEYGMEILRNWISHNRIF
jgi:hypothetical protein